MKKQSRIMSILVGCIFPFIFVACANGAHTPTQTQSTQAAHITQAKHAAVAFVCTDADLTGAAEQENLLYCDTNQINGVVTNAAPSTYKQAIALAQTKHIIVGTPMSVSQTVDWSGRPITYVEFSNAFHAEHFNPSNGIARIYDQYDRQVYP